MAHRPTRHGAHLRQLARRVTSTSRGSIDGVQTTAKPVASPTARTTRPTGHATTITPRADLLICARGVADQVRQSATTGELVSAITTARATRRQMMPLAPQVGGGRAGLNRRRRVAAMRVKTEIADEGLIRDAWVPDSDSSLGRP